VKRILIIDHQPLIREALRLAVRSVWNQASIIEASCHADAERAGRSSAAVDLVIIDPALPDVEGLESLVILRKTLPLTPIVVFSSSRDPQVAAASYILGASAHMPKSAMMSEITETLRRAASGERVLVAPKTPCASIDKLKTAHKRLETLSPA